MTPIGHGINKIKQKHIDMAHVRKAELFLVKEGKNKKLDSTDIKLYEENATVADFKEASFAKLFDADKYVKEKEEVTGTTYKETTDMTLVSADKHLKYALYVSNK